MTVNERLIEAELLAAFDVASRARDRDAMVDNLSQVGVEDAAGSADAILVDPSRYGY